ncbi:MAG TPA: DUF1343 domain-containing protein [Flavobacteriaceae bacterium]|nr:DUF1343 domain-containing protein [Flavobacteriaceae bacterium]
MFYSCLKNTLLFLAALLFSCGTGTHQKNNSSQTETHKTSVPEKNNQNIVVGANRTEMYLPLLKGKKVAVLGNQTSVVFKNEKQTKYTHLVDSLVTLGVNVTTVFSPEHGFRGKAAAGEIVKDGIDVKTGLPIVSLYGDNKKPTPEQLKNIAILIFDIQDVGARFYTYISTLHYVMESCAEQNIPIIILDRPNPNGHYIDGPILEAEHQSFVGMHPVPVVHGMTIGEYAKMINGERWLKNGVQANLTVIEMENYHKQKSYSLPIKPSPNLPNDQAINLYPSLCFFEGTSVSAGRGTDHQFQVFGSPFLDKSVYGYSFVPKPNAGSKYPKHEGETCYGKNLSNFPRLSKINLKWLIEAYQNTENSSEFFTPFFTKLAGTETLQQQIEQGFSAEKIRKSWEKGLKEYDKMREEYLLYE